ncbi:hypothetical protein OG778_32395 [Streptomyces sp. NBC_00184]|uniref:hypothetical protein n=1 Tax=Streptomyces sp. NBC_00184 TaxID=2975673 RepID=UPI002E2CF3A5|nr:hypothetical protein [Streptomyces sp. NBC_00184]
MRWSDVDLGGATLTVNRTRTLMGNKVVVEKDTKSLAGERQLPLPDLVGEALAGFKATQITEKLDAGERYEGNGYVLVDGLGRALNGRQLRERAYTGMAENALRRSVCTTPVRAVSRTWRTKGCRTIFLPGGPGTPTSARPSAGT